MNVQTSRGRLRGNYKVNQMIIQRNKNIREDFIQMKNEGVKNRDAFFFLAEKYFLSKGTINSIIYARK
jgi:hypothetical protein